MRVEDTRELNPSVSRDVRVCMYARRVRESRVSTYIRGYRRVRSILERAAAPLATPEIDELEYQNSQ